MTPDAQDPYRPMSGTMTIGAWPKRQFYCRVCGTHRTGSVNQRVCSIEQNPCCRPAWQAILDQRKNVK